MCGICLVLFDTPSTGNDSNRFSFPDWIEAIGLAELMQRRGPDHFSHHSILLDETRLLCGASGVLHIRGVGSVTKQPLVERPDGNGSFLLYNGEVYEGLDQLTEDSNDTDLLFDHLQRQTVENGHLAMVSFLTKLEGPFSLAFFDNSHRQLWFCRDAFGRRSLLYGTSSQSANDERSEVKAKFLLSSVAIRSNASSEGSSAVLWTELPAGYIFSLRFDPRSANDELVAYRLRPTPAMDDIQNLVSNFKNFQLVDVESPAWHGLFHLAEQSRDEKTAADEFTNDDAFERWYLDNYGKAVDRFLDELRKAIRKRIRFISKFCHVCHKDICQEHCPHPQVALLFSGGVDSLLLAVLLAEELSESDRSVDLLNVSFSNPPSSAPDRITGSAAFMELQRLHTEACQKWNFVKIDIDQAELSTWRHRRIAQLVLPSETVLDDSIGCVLWFAARGIGVAGPKYSNDSKPVSYVCPCRVIFLGSGADELLAGYSRHRKRYFDVPEEGKRVSALIEELEMELRRIGSRNLARDDRVVADHGRETRLPYLDEQFVKYVNALPLEVKCDLRRGRGVGEKTILRMALRKLGVGSQFYRLPKRAMQFGSRIAKAENRKEKGSDKCGRLVLNTD